MTGTLARPDASSPDRATDQATSPTNDWASDPRFDTQIHRRKTRSVRVGNIWVGSDHPVVVQSMINEDTLD
ncbi:MAG: 4-hydroxy-3-methylbut-2-en-1-yl diphosphate synthase, partial [Cyanobacteria bacterium M_DeepCast_100m_m1_067]|nr:4-hydroxy-3-methylbut-2-en-1-yl diphosphate synthase [Cyanobacteria bacterium M_DeepCast_100m_m1_067]